MLLQERDRLVARPARLSTYLRVNENVFEQLRRAGIVADDTLE